MTGGGGSMRSTARWVLAACLQRWSRRRRRPAGGRSPGGRRLDLATARREALAAVAEDPLGADAVAAAQWWLDTMSDLPDPGEILTVVDGTRDPELDFLLARVEAELVGRPPVGSLGPAELAGPFGVFGVLDLERAWSRPTMACPRSAPRGAAPGSPTASWFRPPTPRSQFPNRWMPAASCWRRGRWTRPRTSTAGWLWSPAAASTSSSTGGSSTGCGTA